MTDLIDAPPARRIRFDPTRARAREEYSVAHRHSRRVRWLKFALPTVAVAGIAVFFFAFHLESSGGNDAVSLAGINIEKKKLVMKTPHISGFEGTRRAYDVRAVRAVQDLNNPKVVTLEKITAKFGLDGDSTATLDATTGIFDSAANLLTLRNGITIATTDGYSAKFEQARVDIGKGILTSMKPLEIRSTDGVIKANGITVADRGKSIKFVGGVSLSFTMPVASDGGGAVTAADPEPAVEATPDEKEIVPAEGTE